MIKAYRIPCGSGFLECGKRTLAMGIVNVTPDSFSDGGSFFSSDAAVSQGIRLYESGADILDIGGESTRPFSAPVPIEEEIRRVVPVIETLARKIPIPISVDTRKAEVAKQALDAGACLINDISALQYDPKMAALAARRQVPVVLMHMKGSPENMQLQPHYENVVTEVISFLKQALDHAEQKGIKRSCLIVDPGIGFGKTFAHNLTILKNLDRFLELDVPVLIGTSRKAFIRSLLKTSSDKEPAPQSVEVEIGSQASAAAAAVKGAHILRVHDVANTVVTLKIIDAIKNASG
jgi:dihydropteroate synthase